MMLAIGSVAWATVAPWLGPVIMWIAPRLARIRTVVGGVGASAAPLAGLAVFAMAIGVGAWMIHDRRETLRSEGETRCVEAVAAITIEQLQAERDRADRAERAASEAREAARQDGEGFATRLTDLERELSTRPRKTVCYPAALARRLNKL